jgi:hypothetical protein
MNPKYIINYTRIVGEHNNLHENVIAIWDQPIKEVQP